MNWSDVIYLIGITDGQDENGFPAPVESKPRMVFANEKSIRSNEYYLAKQNGIELSYMFEIRTIDYEGEEKLKYNDENHLIERIYKKGEFMELVCKRRADDHS